jgi:hypothetical protein
MATLEELEARVAALERNFDPIKYASQEEMSQVQKQISALKSGVRIPLFEFTKKMSSSTAGEDIYTLTDYQFKNGEEYPAIVNGEETVATIQYDPEDGRVFIRIISHHILLVGVRPYGSAGVKFSAIWESGYTPIPDASVVIYVTMSEGEQAIKEVAALSNKIGDLPDGQTIVGYVDGKTVSWDNITDKPEVEDMITEVVTDKIGTLPDGQTVVEMIKNNNKEVFRGEDLVEANNGAVFKCIIPAGQNGITFDAIKDFDGYYFSYVYDLEAVDINGRRFDVSETTCSAGEGLYFDVGEYLHLTGTADQNYTVSSPTTITAYDPWGGEDYIPREITFYSKTKPSVNWDDITDKPSYTETQTLPVFEYTIPAGQGGDDEYVRVDTPFMLKEGISYRVVINGVEFYGSPYFNEDANLWIYDQDGMFFVMIAEHEDSSPVLIKANDPTTRGSSVARHIIIYGETTSIESTIMRASTNSSRIASLENAIGDLDVEQTNEKIAIAQRTANDGLYFAQQGLLLAQEGLDKVNAADRKAQYALDKANDNTSKIGTVPDGKTVIECVNDAQNTANQAQTTANQIATLPKHQLPYTAEEIEAKLANL